MPFNTRDSCCQTCRRRSFTSGLMSESKQAGGPAGVEWRGFLRSLPFEVWQRLEWSKADVDLRLSDFTSGAQQIFEGLASANFSDQQNEFSLYLGNSKSRIQSIGSYIRESRSLPSILILIDCGPALEVVDGCHRLATFFFLKANGFSDELLPIRQLAWVGRYPGIPPHSAVHPHSHAV